MCLYINVRENRRHTRELDNPETQDTEQTNRPTDEQHDHTKGKLAKDKQFPFLMKHQP